MTANKTVLAKKSDITHFSKSSLHDLVNSESLWLANFTSKQTQRTYRAAFREFCGYLGIADSDAFRVLSSADIILYRDWLVEQGKSNRSVRNRLAAISSCYKYLISKNEIDTNPIDGVKRPKVDESSGETPALTPNQVKHLLQQPDTSTLQGARDSAILYFLFYRGSLTIRAICCHSVI